MGYFIADPFCPSAPNYVSTDPRTGKLYQAEQSKGNTFEFNLEDYLNQKFKAANPRYGSESCSLGKPSLCGKHQSGLKVSFVDWVKSLGEESTWEEHTDALNEFRQAYEALQNEAKAKQRKAPAKGGSGANKVRLARTSALRPASFIPSTSSSRPTKKPTTTPTTTPSVTASSASTQTATFTQPAPVLDLEERERLSTQAPSAVDFRQRSAMMAEGEEEVTPGQVVAWVAVTGLATVIGAGFIYLDWIKPWLQKHGFRS